MPAKNPNGRNGPTGGMGGMSGLGRPSRPQRAQNKAAKTYITPDQAASARGKQAAQTRADNIERDAQRRANAARAEGSKSGFRKGAVAGGAVGVAGGRVLGGGAVEDKKKSPARTNTSVPAKRTGGATRKKK